MDVLKFNADKAREKVIAAGKYKEWTYDDVIQASISSRNQEK